MRPGIKSLAGLRLYSQQVSRPRFSKPSELLQWMGAIQAQNFEMAKWALGLRLKQPTESTLQKAYNDGKILRTHVLRPTWHFVLPEDLVWMLRLSAAPIKSSMQARHKQLGLTSAVINQSQKIIEDAFSNSPALTREELVAILGHKIRSTQPQFYAHVLLHAELDALICSGPMIGKKHSYALLAERLRGIPQRQFSKDEALNELARRYFSSRAIATVYDFAWWSGTSVKEGRKILRQLRPALSSKVIDDQEFWFFPETLEQEHATDSLYLLPAYDELLISYKNRSDLITEQSHKKMISNNGLFKPVIVYNGRIIGTWKPIKKKLDMTVTTSFFGGKTNIAIKQALGKAILAYREFFKANPKI